MSKTYDEIVKQPATEKAEEKLNQVSKTRKMKAQNGLRSKVDNAEIVLIEAEEAFENAVIGGGDISGTALAVKGAEETLKFYKDLYNTLFVPLGNTPNKQ